MTSSTPAILILTHDKQLNMVSKAEGLIHSLKDGRETVRAIEYLVCVSQNEKMLQITSSFL